MSWCRDEAVHARPAGYLPPLVAVASDSAISPVEPRRCSETGSRWSYVWASPPGDIYPILGLQWFALYSAFDVLCPGSIQHNLGCRGADRRVVVRLGAGGNRLNRKEDVTERTEL